MSSEPLRSEPIRPQYFLSRPDGTLTALIAVDELPQNFVIDGVPRVLGHGDTTGMTSLGTVASRGQVYSVQTASDGDDVNHLKSIKNATKSVKDSQQTNSTGSKDPAKNKSEAQETPKKIYCAYWVRTGQCDFLQQGCKYKHEMNPTILNKLSMRDVPKWYRDKYGASSMKTRYQGNQKPGDKKAGNSDGKNSGLDDAETVGSRRDEKLSKWRKPTDAAPSSMQGNASKGSSGAAGSPDLLTQDLLPNYPALNPSGSSAENVLSGPSSASKQKAHVNDPQTTTHGQIKSPHPKTPQKGKERSLAQETSAPTATTPPSSNSAVTSGTGSAASSAQRQTRRQRSRESYQAQPTSGSPDSKISTQPSAEGNAPGNVNSNGSPTAKASMGELPRLEIPQSKIIGAISASSSNPHNRSPSTFGSAKPTTNVGKHEKDQQAKSGKSDNSENDGGSESTKSTSATRDDTMSAGKGLKPGAKTDIFGLGIYDN